MYVPYRAGSRTGETLGSALLRNTARVDLSGHTREPAIPIGSGAAVDRKSVIMGGAPRAYERFKIEK
jgi:hypothetical protein